MTAVLAKFDGSDLVAGSAAVNVTLHPIRSTDVIISYTIGTEVVLIKVTP